MLIYLVMANSDMTEGCGPMKLVTIMSDKEKAIQYAMEQPGVMGIKNRQTRCFQPFKFHSFDWNSPSMIGIQLVKGDWDVIEVYIEK